MDQQLYQAELDNIPAAFADGSMWSGVRQGHRSLMVHTQSPGQYVEIQASHIGTMLVVRQSGHSLSLSVRSPRGVVEAFGPEQDLQLCVWGCPPSQRLNMPYTLQPHSVAPATSSAEAHCAAVLPVRDVYFQACVFDLITSGDLNSSTPAVSALQDARNMINTDEIHLLPVASTGRAHPHLTVFLLHVLLGTLSRV